MLSCERALYKHVQKSKNHLSVRDSVALSVSSHIKNKARSSGTKAGSLELLLEHSKKAGYSVPLQRIVSNVQFSQSDEEVLVVNMQDLCASGVGKNALEIRMDHLGRDVMPDVSCGPLTVHFPYTRLFRMNPTIVFANGFTALEVESQLRVLFNVMGSNDSLIHVDNIEGGLKTVKDNLRDHQSNGDTARILLEVFRLSYQEDKKFFCDETLFIGCREAYHVLFELGNGFAFDEQKLFPYVKKICMEHQGLKAIFLPVKILVDGRAKWLLVYIKFSGLLGRKNYCLILDFDDYCGQTYLISRRKNLEKQVKRFGNCFSYSSKTQSLSRSQGWNMKWENMFDSERGNEHQHSGQRLVLTTALLHLAGFDRKPDSVILKEIREICYSKNNTSLGFMKLIELELLHQAELRVEFVDNKYAVGDGGMPPLDISSQNGRERTNINLYYHIRGTKQFWPRFISGSAKHYEF